jgi:hypothetical protein
MKNQTSCRIPTMLCMTLLIAFVTFWQGSPAAAESSSVVGTAAKGVSAVEYIGVIKQIGLDFTTVGYLTYVNGLDPADLYTDPNNPGASTARFTFSGSAISNPASHANVGAVTQLSGVGPLKIYFNEFGGATFDNPSSFTAGTEIATFDTRVSNILVVIAPNQGVSSAASDAKQQTAQRFVLNGKRLQFGHPQLIQRVTLFGGATRSDPNVPVSITEFAAFGVTP